MAWQGKNQMSTQLFISSDVQIEMSGKGPKVLLVDDSRTSLRGMKRILGQPWEKDLASSAEEALELIKENTYLAVITDCDMTGKNGIWLLEQLKDHTPHAVRILTSAGDPDRFKTHIESGLVQCFLKKPLDCQELIDFMTPLEDIKN